MNSQIVDEIKIYGRSLAPSGKLDDLATILVLEMARSDDIEIIPTNAVSARSVRHLPAWEVVRAWVNSKRGRVLIGQNLTKIGTATCELNGVKYWCVLTQ